MRTAFRIVAASVALAGVVVGCSPAAEQSSTQAVDAPENYPAGALEPPTAEEKARITELGPVEGCRDSVPFVPTGEVGAPASKSGQAPATGAKSGRLSPEVIQRKVRENFSAFRGCYEPRLRFNPNLEGRVATSFVIGRDGAVSAVYILDNTIPDCFVAQCFVEVFRDLRFPEPEGGIVTVTYPVMFSPG